jgi:hypothetical protein
MTAKRYIVLDGDGVVVNAIVVDDPVPKGYWPGYGKTLVPLEPATFSKGGAGLDVVVFDKWPVLPQIGDAVDLTTGVVTKYIPKLVMSGSDLVALAPDTKLSTDAQPKSDGGTITEKISTASVDEKVK